MGCYHWRFLKYMLKNMGFNERWPAWMESLVCSSWMSVIVNGSPTKYFKVSRGLRQGDPMSPFLFVIIWEGLSVLVRKVIEIQELKPFNLEGTCDVSIL